MTNQPSIDKRTAARFWAKVDVSDPASCWEWMAARFPDGYGAVKVKGRSHRAHRVSFALINGGIPDGLCVCHRCDNRACVNPSHLFLGTQADNIADMVRKGRQAGGKGNPGWCGERHGRAKLTSRQVAHIRERYSAGERQSALAARFGVSRSAISRIVTHNRWSHLRPVEHD